MRRHTIIFLMACVITLAGCETLKSIWGSSTQTLEDAIPQGLSRTYGCVFRDCYQAILALDQNDQSRIPKTKKYFNVFLKDPIRGRIVVMGIPEQVDTTEVGIFLTEESSGSIRIDVTSLSTQAKEKVATAVFNELDQSFSKK